MPTGLDVLRQGTSPLDYVSLLESTASLSMPRNNTQFLSSSKPKYHTTTLTLWTNLDFIPLMWSCCTYFITTNSFLQQLQCTINECEPTFHACNKHIELNYYYVQGHIALGLLHTWHTPDTLQIGDIFTIPLWCPTLHSLQSKLGLL